MHSYPDKYQQDAHHWLRSILPVVSRLREYRHRDAIAFRISRITSSDISEILSTFPENTYPEFTEAAYIPLYTPATPTHIQEILIANKIEKNSGIISLYNYPTHDIVYIDIVKHPGRFVDPATMIGARIRWKELHRTE